MQLLVHHKTFIPEKGLWVSTVSYDYEIGLDRCAETMVFKGNKDEITDYEDLHFESHGHETDKDVLKKEHDRIVEYVKTNELEP